MKYFSKELIAGYQPDSPSERQSHRKWRANGAAYLRQLRRLLPRLGANARKFFAEHDLHDGILVQAAVGDAMGRSPTPSMRKSLYSNRRTTALLTVLSNFNAPRVYALTYTGVTVFEVRCDNSLFPYPGAVFGDWLYDELLPEKGGLFRHNILFQTGTKLSIVFGHFRYRRSGGQTPARERKARAGLASKNR